MISEHKTPSGTVQAMQLSEATLARFAREVAKYPPEQAQ